MRERLIEQIKTRVTKDTKKELKKLAREKKLDVAEVQREAFAEYISKSSQNGKSA